MYSITAKSAPSAGSLRSAAVGAQLPPFGTGPVPITHRTAGAASAGRPLTCHRAGVSMKSPAPSACRTRPGGGGEREGLAVAVARGELAGVRGAAGTDVARPGAGRPSPPRKAPTADAAAMTTATATALA